MKKLSNWLAAACVLCLLVGLSGGGDGTLSGFALAIGAVMFILAFITRLMDKAETVR